MNYKKKYLMTGWLLAFSFLVLMTVADSAQKRPNLLFILSDDQGWGDIGFHDPALYSPNLDRLAEQNLELTHHYAAPQCTPSRVSFLTGRYAQRFGPQAIIAGYNVQAIPFGTPTLASLLKAQGYDTALIGKWHLGSVPGQHPNLWGFDYSYGSLGGAVGVYDHRYRLRKKDYVNTWHRNGELIPGHENGKPYEEGTHVTDLITKDAIRFLKQKREQPFFLYLAYTAVHTPLAEEDKWFKDPEGKIQKIKDESRRLMAASVHHLDDAVGQVLQALAETGVLENTIVVYSSDNGGVAGGHQGGGYAEPNPDLKPGYSSNGELRSGKTHVYEGGIRVPTIVSWPGVLGKGVIDDPVHICDWLPTFGKIAGVELPSNLDGRDILPVLKGEPAEPRGFYWARGKQIPWSRRAVRRGGWKLVNEGQSWALYHLETDPGEQKNLAEKYPEKVKSLLDFYESEAAKDEGRPLMSVWIKGPKTVTSGRDAVFELVCSEPMKLMKDDLYIDGAEVTAIEHRGKTVSVTVQSTGKPQIILQVKEGVIKNENGRVNQPSSPFRCAVEKGN
ncbi:sulfatase-like hydrolase/transferase [Pontiella agarivorans]|uniref:Sulfatase-like hydrolase/transferase n=1 Tax=Pontiella agarivorans TaxID=3038953 RepID=A0ABU5N281_9BACT|nr:sulfatase-like hydrolase/transferase [Pontiella agarivorans]MDZ8120518.1 sulfatase-like hydrolase/transferase [Pontiella agarivorans]